MNALDMALIIRSFPLRHCRSFALANGPLIAPRIEFLPAHFSIDRVKKIIDGRRSVMISAEISGLFRRLTSIVERKSALLDQLAAPDAIYANSVAVSTDRNQFRI